MPPSATPNEANEAIEAKRPIFTYRDLIVWQKGIMLVTETYDVTAGFPREEIYGLTSQMRRAATSIPSNIAEGRRKGSTKDFLKFLRIAYGSGAELETQIEIAKRLPMTAHLNYQKVDSLLNEIMRMLHVIIQKLRPIHKLPKKNPNEATGI